MISELVYFTGVSYGFLLSVIFPQPEMAMSMIPVIIVPFMVLAGFLVNQNNIPYYFYPIEYVSMFKYGFQASIWNEFSDSTWYCSPNVECFPLDEQNFAESMWTCIAILFGLGVGIRILAYCGLVYLSNPKRPKLEKYKN